MTDFLALAAGLGLTWAFGVTLVAALYRAAPAAQPHPVAWTLGTGWFVGMFVTTLLMRALSQAGVSFGVVAIGGPLVIATAVAGWFAMRGQASAWRADLRDAASGLGGRGLDGWQRLAWRLIIAWLAIRFALLFAEVWWRPLYPWDAWTQWGTKARVWFEMRSIVPFVGLHEWLAAPGTMLWFDAAPGYPGTIPLVQTWAALLIGQWDDARVNLPWWISGVAFAMALYGGMRLLAFQPLAALVATALVLTLPIVNVHIALAGYADLPTAIFLTLGTIATLRAIDSRRASDMVLAAVLLVALVMTKNPGKAWIVMFMPAFLVAALPRHGLRLAMVMFAAALFALLVAMRGGLTLLGYKFYLQSAMPWGALFDAYFSFANWHLLWYAAVATALIGWRRLLAPGVAPLTLAVASGLLFLFIGFAFTHAAAWVEDQSTVNRATLHLAPLVVVWIFVAMRGWLRHALPVEAAAATA